GFRVLDFGFWISWEGTRGTTREDPPQIPWPHPADAPRPVAHPGALPARLALPRRPAARAGLSLLPSLRRRADAVRGHRRQHRPIGIVVSPVQSHLPHPLVRG